MRICTPALSSSPDFVLPELCDAGSSSSQNTVNNSCGRRTPRSANRRADANCIWSSGDDAATNSAEASRSRSTDRHMETMRLTSFTAGPTTVKSSRSSPPMFP